MTIADQKKNRLAQIAEVQKAKFDRDKVFLEQVLGETLKEAQSVVYSMKYNPAVIFPGHKPIEVGKVNNRAIFMVKLHGSPKGFENFADALIAAEKKPSFWERWFGK